MRARTVDRDVTIADGQRIAFDQPLRLNGVRLAPDWDRRNAGLSFIELLIEMTAVHGDRPTSAITASGQQRLAAVRRPSPVPVTIDLFDQAHRRGLPRAVTSSRLLLITGLRARRLPPLLAAVRLHPPDRSARTPSEPAS